jgi:hypothetical protein
MHGGLSVGAGEHWAVQGSPDKTDAVAMAVYQLVDAEMIRAFSELNASGRAYW